MSSRQLLVVLLVLVLVFALTLQARGQTGILVTDADITREIIPTLEPGAQNAAETVSQHITINYSDKVRALIIIPIPPGLSAAAAEAPRKYFTYLPLALK